MQKRKYKNIPLEISLLGMGAMRLPLDKETGEIDYPRAKAVIDSAYNAGLNYFDTAFNYIKGTSEVILGRALREYPRDSYYIADKLPSWSIEGEGGVDAVFNKQLKRMELDYFDFYLCHAVNRDNYKVYSKFESYERLSELKKQGKIKYLGFSFHDKPEFLEQVLNDHEWDFVQIQLNYLDWEMQDAKNQYRLIEERGIPCIIMEPVRGGALASLSPEAEAVLKAEKPDASVASWAIRYAASLPNVLTVLSGMSTEEQVADNVKTMSPFQPLSDRERGVLHNAVDIYRQKAMIPCTGCRYCMDCPSGVDIPGVFAFYNKFAIDRKDFANNMTFKRGYRELADQIRPKNCSGCQACVSHCPQNIQIDEKMKQLGELAVSLGLETAPEAQ